MTIHIVIVIYVFILEFAGSCAIFPSAVRCPSAVWSPSIRRPRAVRPPSDVRPPVVRRLSRGGAVAMGAGASAEGI